MRRWYGGSDRLINEGHYEGLQMPRPLVPNRRGRLLAAARELFHEQGWPRTTVADIAARAGVGKGAVYLEFADKARVLDALIRDSTRQLVDQVRQRVQSADGLVGLAQVYRFGVEELLGDPLMCALYLGDADLLGAHMAQMPEERYRERVGWLDEYARGLQHAGVISEGIEPDHIDDGLMHPYADDRHELAVTVARVHEAEAPGDEPAERRLDVAGGEFRRACHRTRRPSRQRRRPRSPHACRREPDPEGHGSSAWRCRHH